MSPLRTSALACVIACTLAVSSSASAQTPPAPVTPPASNADADAAKKHEAFERFERALSLYKEGNHHAALMEFRASYAAWPAYKVLYNIGQVSFQLQDYVGALTSFRRYLAEGGAAIPAARRSEVEREIATLGARVSNVTIATSIMDAEITIDDTLVGKSPLAAPVLVGAGRHKITLTKEGRGTVTRVVDLAGASDVRVELDGAQMPQVALLPIDARKPPIAPARRPKRLEPETRLHFTMTTLSWIGVGAASALGVGATVTGLLSLKTSRDLRDSPHDPGSAASDRSDVTRLALVTDVLVIASVATLATTLVLSLTSDTSKRVDASAVTVGISPTRATLGLRF